MRYDIPIVYQSVMTMSVEADNLEEAVTKALKEFLSIPDDNYLQDSFEIDGILEENYPDEKYNLNNVLNNL